MKRKNNKDGYSFLLFLDVSIKIRTSRYPKIPIDATGIPKIDEYLLSATLLQLIFELKSHSGT
jgi:hypothetical protein